MNDEKQLHSLLNLLICSWFMQECIDNLKGTTYDTHTLKMRLRQLEPELQKKIDKDLNLLWGTDDSALYDLQDGFRKFIGEFSTMRLENIVGFGELLERFKAMPDWVLHSLGVKIKEAA